MITRMKIVIIVFVSGMIILQNTPIDAKVEEYRFTSSQVKTQERILKVTVFFYNGNEQWARHVLDLSLKVLPLIEEIAGVPYPEVNDISIYQTRTIGEAGGWGAAYKGGGTINLFPEETDDTTIIHENAHIWTNNSIQWMAEGFADFYVYLTLEKLNRKSEANRKKNWWIWNFIEINKNTDWFLENQFYESPKPENWTEEDEKRRNYCYFKSFTFVYILYKEFGLESIQKIDTSSCSLKEILEKKSGKNLDDFFSGWINEGAYNIYSPKDFVDNDKDGITNFDERSLKTNPDTPDSDSDGIGDGGELDLETDPLNADTDGDGKEDGQELGIVIDGLVYEWNEIEPIVTDQKGDVVGDDERGADIRMIKLAMDENYLYVLLEIYGEFCFDRYINYYIDISYDGKFWDYGFGFRPNGDVWILSHDKKTAKWIEIEASEGMTAFGRINELEVKIPRRYFKIPDNFTTGCRIVYYIANLDETKYDILFSKKEHEIATIITNPLIPDITPTQRLDFDEANSLLEQGIKSFKSLNFQEAMNLFIQALQEFHELKYERKVKEAEEWIGKCQEEIERKRIMEEIDTFIALAKEEFQKQDFEKAREIFENIKERYQEIREDSAAREIEDWIKKCDEEMKKKSRTPTSVSGRKKEGGFISLSILLFIMVLIAKKL